MHKLYLCTVITLISTISIAGEGTQDYTWICEADLTVHGQPTAQEVQSLSQEVNEALNLRKEKHIAQACTTNDLQSYTYEVQYKDQPDQLQDGPYAELVQELKDQERIHLDQATDDAAIFLQTAQQEIQINHFSCLYSCNAPSDLSHLQ